MKVSLNYNSPKREIWHTYTTDVKLPENGSAIRGLSEGTLRAKVVASFAEVEWPGRNAQEVISLAETLGPVVSVQVVRPVSFNTDPTVDKLISTLLDLRADALARKDTLLADKIENQLRATGIVICPGGETYVWPKLPNETTKKH